MIVFGYDGSLNGDWVAHYAIRFAANAALPLRVVHVEPKSPVAELEARLARIEAEARQAGVAIEIEVVRDGAEVAGALAVRGERGTLVLGTRARPRNRSFLTDTVAARVLERARGAVVAVHVVHPGLLGQPHRALVPFVGADDSDPGPVLRLLGAELHAVHVLLVQPISVLGERFASSGRTARSLEAARARLVTLERRVHAALVEPCELDGSAVLSADPPRDIRVAALAHRSRLVVLDAGLGNAQLEAVLAAAPADVAIKRAPP